MEHIRGKEAFVGRAHELAELRAGVDSAVGGQGRFFTISGEPGVGKSRLSREAAAYAESQGGKVLLGRCWEHGGAPAYWPWMQVVRGLMNGADSASLAQRLGAGAADVAQIAPELRERISGLPAPASAALASPEQARFRLFDSIISFLRKSAETRPLLIVLDDLHAADPTSIMLLVALARQARTTRSVVIGTYREAEVRNNSELAPLISQAEREGAVFPLRGFEEDDIREFVERGWGVTAAQALVNQLRDITEGNPFFLNEVLRQMATERRLAANAALDPKSLGLTRGVRDFIKALAQPLSSEARKTLEVAAVIGREFELRALEAVTEAPRADLIERLDEAVSLDLVSDSRGAHGRYSFRHTLIREALYDALSGGLRRELHHAVAEASRKLGGSSAVIAYHYRQVASPDDADRAIEYSRKAAREAQAQLAFEEAASHLKNAIDTLELKREPDETLRTELLCELGEAQVRAGDLAGGRETSLKAAEIARSLDRPEVFARSLVDQAEAISRARERHSELFPRAVVTAGRGVSNSGVTDAKLVELLNEALKRLGQEDSPLRAQALSRLGVELYWSERERASALCQEAVEMARRLNDRHATIVALWGRHLTLRNPDSLEQRLADGREVIELAERAGERDFALEARYYRMADLVEAGDVDAFDTGLREYLAAEEQLRDRFGRGFLLQCMRALMDGRLQESGTLAQQAFMAGQQSGRPLALNSFLVQHGNAMRELGRIGELQQALRGFVVQNPAIVFARCALQLSLVETGQTEEARVAFLKMAADDFCEVPRDWNWLPAMFVLSEVCVALGEAGHAETLYRLLSPYASRNAVLGYVYTYGSVAYALGKLAAVMEKFDEAEAHFEAAIAANRKIRAAVWTAHAEFELGALLLTRGKEADRETAQGLIEAARRASQSLGLVRLGNKLAALSVGAGGGQEQETRIEGPPASGAGTLEALAESAIAQARDLTALASLVGTVTILFSDLEDSSSLYEKFGDIKAHEILRAHNEIFRRQVAAFRGHEVKALGDGFMVAFSSARRGAQCAIAVQRAFAAYSRRNPDMPLKVRMGLHVGEAISESSDLFGKAVILASRVAGLAEGGQILVSSMLHDLAANAGDLRFNPLGEKQFKGLGGAHSVYELDWRA